MSEIVIKHLVDHRTLDGEAMAAVSGGHGLHLFGYDISFGIGIIGDPPGPVIRDHRKVRDHRTDPVIHDHRTPSVL